MFDQVPPRLLGSLSVANDGMAEDWYRSFAMRLAPAGPGLLGGPFAQVSLVQLVQSGRCIPWA